MFTFMKIIGMVLVALYLVSCANSSVEHQPPDQIESTFTPTLTVINPQPTLTIDLEKYEFPVRIDPDKQYMFYLHGKIIEDQGLPAISPDFGEYGYQAILERLAGNGFVVISEQRTKDTEGVAYARKISSQIKTLIEAGVPARNITVVGASKGGAIAIYISYFLEDDEVNFVLLAICHPDYVSELIQDEIILHGYVLSIFDKTDEFAGSCQKLFSFSERKGLSKSAEVVLDIGLGHGMLYQPLDEWMLPVVQWAKNDSY
jgi:hypothetical protein